MSSTDNRAPQLVAITVVFLALNISSVTIRIFTRLRLVKWLGLDDVLILCATIAAIAEAAGTIIATHYGLGRHIDQQPSEWRKPYAQADLTASLSYSVAAMFVKLSLLSFYLRLSPNHSFRMITYAVIFSAAGFGISSVLAAGLQCVPVSMLWNPDQPGHCININTFYFANAGIHIFTELLIYLLPIRTLWKLHLPMRQKMGLCCLMSIGGGLIIISCYRLVTIRDLLASDDITWNVVSPLIWYNIEVNLAIFVACGPAFLAFFRHYIPAVFGASSGSRTFRHSYPLGSVGYPPTYGARDTSGNKTTVTIRDPYFTSVNNSEDMIVMSNAGGIKKQVDVWVDNEELGTMKSNPRSEIQNEIKRLDVEDSGGVRL